MTCEILPIYVYHGSFASRHKLVHRVIEPQQLIHPLVYTVAVTRVTNDSRHSRSWPCHPVVWIAKQLDKRFLCLLYLRVLRVRWRFLPLDFRKVRAPSPECPSTITPTYTQTRLNLNWHICRSVTSHHAPRDTCRCYAVHLMAYNTRGVSASQHRLLVGSWKQAICIISIFRYLHSKHSYNVTCYFIVAVVLTLGVYLCLRHLTSAVSEMPERNYLMHMGLGHLVSFLTSYNFVDLFI